MIRKGVMAHARLATTLFMIGTESSSSVFLAPPSLRANLDPSTWVANKIESSDTGSVRGTGSVVGSRIDRWDRMRGQIPRGYTPYNWHLSLDVGLDRTPSWVIVIGLAGHTYVPLVSLKLG